MDFADATRALEHALQFGIHPSLDGIRELTEELGRPQDDFACVQITGTNGKTSVTRLVSALLSAEGVRSAAYTSPHLESYTERVEIDGAPASEHDFAVALVAAFEAARGTGKYADDFTEFELLTAAALWLMRDKDVEIACLEVGMGGRWDATSVVDPAVAVITGVGLDHTDRLGSTIEEIAADKAQIIKAGSQVVLGPGSTPVAEIFLQRAVDVGVPVVFVAGEDDLATDADRTRTATFRVVERPSRPGGTLVLVVRTPLATYVDLRVVAPSYQAPNIATALVAAELALGRALHLAEVRKALAAIKFPGRFEVVAEEPPVVLDGAHNPQAATVLAGAIAEAWPDPAVRPWCLLGMLTDKDADGVIAALVPVVAGFVATQPVTHRALEAGSLAAKIARATGEWPDIHASLGPAISFARAGGGEAGIVVTGSLYTAGQARRVLLGDVTDTGSGEGRGPLAARQALMKDVQLP